FELKIPELRLHPHLYISQFPKCFHGAQSQNVELIGAHIGGSADPLVGAHTSWLSQTICHV
ncbi:MAG: hypothetical protein ACKPJF_29705, partial [Dolichospermum sp.]